MLTDRTEQRVGEKLAIILTKPFQLLAPRFLSTPIETLAKSMIASTLFKSPDAKPVEILDNNKIFDLAEEYDKSF